MSKRGKTTLRVHRNEMARREGALTVLEKAHALLSTVGWTREALARDAEGTPVPASSPDARGYCISGALDLAADIARPGFNLAAGSLPFDIWSVAHARLRAEANCSSIITWNDHPNRNAKEVLDLFERAIAKLTKEVVG